MKRVLVVLNSDLIRAGVPNVVMTIARGLSDKFVFDAVTYGTAAGDYDSEFEALGGRIYRLSLLDYDSHKLTYPMRFFQIKKALNKILKGTAYDIIHCHNGIEAGIFLSLANKHGILKRIAHAHGNYTRGGSNKILLWYHNFCKKLIHRHATDRLACSSVAGETLYSCDDFLNVLNCVDTSLYVNLPKQHHDTVNLLQIGYFCQNKNQLFSIKLLKELLSRSLPARLSFIGFKQGEEYYNDMLKAISDLELDNYVNFLPPDTDKTKVFPFTDAVLLPSFSEGLPLVALEAQASNTYCIASDRVPKDADLGLVRFAALDDTDAWCSAIKDLDFSGDKPRVNIDAIDRNCWIKRIEDIYNAG